jgi:coatomer protein complex subunit alpha (xenin)
MGTLIDRFEEHDAGPVRGIDFHPTQPLFCSGGDDYKIKVWNHKLRRCLFTLLGHLDYIRTVQFHREQPWIVSASDDQTLRIWNWQGRSCISVLTGHNHYVMSASFHPKDDLVVSASLDQTLRLWDISGLKKQKSSSSELLNVNINQELFGGNDVMVKLILEGHEKGVNWASFHPTHPLIVSGADDRSIRIWKMDDARGFEIEQLRGHVNNVSCVMYFKDYVISNSEDRSIRVWDVKQRSAVHTFRRDSDRFWILAVHPDRNLIAAGHDTGMIVFKLERERPAYCMNGNTLCWVKDRQLKSYDFDSGQEETLVQLRRNTYPPLSLSYCPSEGMALFYYDNDGGTFELYSIPKNGTNADDVKKGFYTAAVFFSRSKFAVLDKTRQVVLRNKNNDIMKVLPPIGSADYLFPAANGQVLARADDKVSLFDMSQKRVIGECSATKVKYVVWASDMSRVALLSKHSIVCANRKLKSLCSLHESSRIKSAGYVPCPSCSVMQLLCCDSLYTTCVVFYHRSMCCSISFCLPVLCV